MESNKRGEKIKLEPWKIWLIVGILFGTALLIYGPHFSYPYPFHIDKWHHIGYAERIIYDQNYNASVVFSNGNLEIGYHLFLVGLFSVERAVGIDPVLAYKFLPAFFACIASLILFFMMFRFTKNYWIGIFSMLFFATLKTNVNFLGLWFAVPLTFCIPLIFLFFWLFMEGWNKKPWLLGWSALVFFIILFSHACSATFMLPILLIYCLINNKPLESKKKRWPWLLFFLIPLIVFPLVYFQFIRKESFISTLHFIFEKLIFRFGFTPTEPYLMPAIKIALFRKIISIHPYFLPWLYGFGAFIFAVIGLFVSFKDKKLKMLTVWFLATAALLFLFINFKFTIFAPYQRIVYYSLLSLAPLSAIGIVWAIEKIRKKEKHANAWIFFIIALTLALSFYNYYNPPKGFGLYTMVDNQDYNALKWFGTQTNNSLVIAPILLGDAVYPLSRNNALVSAFFINTDDVRAEIYHFFSDFTCEQKQEIARKYGANHIISKAQINCSGFENIYSAGDYIYKVQNS